MPESPPSVGRKILLSILTAAVVAVYGYAACGPLRAATSTVADTSGYLGLTAWILDGRPSDMHEVPWRCREFPIGYPSAIAALWTLGLATQQGLLAANLLWLSIGLGACWILLRRAWGMPLEAAWAVLLLVAASTVCCELSVSIASEMLFFAASTVTLVCLERSTPAALCLAVVACAAAIAVRVAGVALIPAVIWGAARHPLLQRLWTRRGLALAALPAALAAWFAVARLVRSEYVASIIFGRYSRGAAWNVVAAQQVAKLSAWGELFTNLRAEEFRSVYRGEFVLAGLICLSAFVMGFWSRRRRLGPLEIYLAAYAAVLFVYPFFSYGSSRRFWFPVLPFLFGMAYLGIGRLREKSLPLDRIARQVLPIYLALFVLGGCLLSYESSRFERDTDREAAVALASLPARQ